VPVRWAWAVAFIVVWALGEHLVMPVRQSLALSIAKEGKSGESLGIVTGAINAGTVVGSILVAAIFFLGVHFWADAPRRVLYDATWVLVALLLAASLAVAGSVKEPGLAKCARPSFYFRRKYTTFYILELFYGARKQVFFTFGPFVLIRVYGMDTQHVAILFAAAALFTALWGGRLIGRLVDRWGYRNVMIWDTVVLFFVCLLYGFAKDWFPSRVAVAVVCVNYVLDAVLSNASMATNLYARTLSDSQEELTATLSSGISVNHAVTVFYALLGGWIWDRFGPGFLFATAAFMALANSAFALTVPKPVKRSRSA
jgi:MFS family permease